MTRDERSELVEIVRASGWHIRVLATVHDSRLPDAWVGAGAIRDLVWGVRFGAGFDPAVVRDVDVAYFDPGDLGRDRDERATRLHDAWPGVPWEARNQAAVHTWYAPKFGRRLGGAVRRSWRRSPPGRDGDDGRRTPRQ